ncbi:TetR/AcrR family transcriptional regulator [Sneathiella sp.]|uniref:TetR/AcrR family transcriptional regulator n=1 Tax=Sneathiella sp. TaxID=1964365 RepID=UPI0035614C87
MASPASVTRKDTVRAFKRQQFVAAARRLYDSTGADGLTMRDIAREAGYSLGATYAYFGSKEEIEAELLAETFSQLARQIRKSLSPGTLGAGEANPFRLFYRHFVRNGKDRQLYLNCLSPDPDRAPSPDANFLTIINNRLIPTLGIMANWLHGTVGFPPVDAQRETLDAIAFITGVLMLSANAPLGAMGEDGEERVDRYLQRMLLRKKQE